MNCEFCQSPVHIWFQCPKKPDGWKPARLAKKRFVKSPSLGMNAPEGKSPEKAAKLISRATPSTAARKDVCGGYRGNPGVVSGVVDKAQALVKGFGPELSEHREAAVPTAGTQALPVDTLKPNPDWYRGIDALPGHEPPPQNPKFDKKAWQRNYMRGYMQRRRAADKLKRDDGK